MASAVYNIAKSGFLDGSIDWDTDTIKAALVMTNTTADTEIDVDTVGAITTLDESDDSGSYARQTLTASVSTDDANDRGEADADNISFTSLTGDATRAYQGILILKEITNDTDNIPIAFVEFPSTIAGTATQVDVTFDAEGVLQLA